MNDEHKLLLTVPECSFRLSIGRSRCYELVLGGQLRSIKLGRRRLIPLEALEAFVKEQMEAAVEAQQ